MGGAPQPHAGALRGAAASSALDRDAALDAALQLPAAAQGAAAPGLQPTSRSGHFSPKCSSHGSAGCAAPTASSSAQNAPAQEESPALDLGLESEKMIREIRNSLPVKAPSAQGNINVGP
ncbi:hypothetical protein DUI87_26218 [Hirundo rustica rustica]|uniref:Uncharacterized protein n=1 Tax=Hirundo rustica rustica TaxID=333673 RepID=A0A3M0J8V3_HIRRU|nr:hypothetical protein DUI87_26218 [Hirundo rustica rustica]